ncbi:MAG: PHP domain-containing protein [Halobacteriaceae archaeon]
MTTQNVAADLHIHTTASDGTATVSERVTQARKKGLDAIAITDHESISSSLASRRDVRDNVEVITGVEIRADLLGSKVEILGYYVDPDDESLLAVLNRIQRYREERNEKIMENLSATTGIEISKSTVPTPRGSLGRPHLADYLVEQGVVSSVQKAFDYYLADDAECFVPMRRVDYDEVIEAVQNAGGVASLAHPGYIQADSVGLEEIVKRLADAGLDAIEGKYPYEETDGRGGKFSYLTAKKFAESHELLLTGGTDCHGPDSGKFRIGSEGISSDLLESIRECADRRRSFT